MEQLSKLARMGEWGLARGGARGTTATPRASSSAASPTASGSWLKHSTKNSDLIDPLPDQIGLCLEWSHVGVVVGHGRIGGVQEGQHRRSYALLKVPVAQFKAHDARLVGRPYFPGEHDRWM
jgi:hypothetical protein